MTREKSLLSDGAWLAGLQGFAALGQLVGVRLLTEILPPAVFGEFSLWLGVIVLAATGLANPTMQAMLRFYPEYALKGRGAFVMTVVSQQLIKLVKWTIPIFIIGSVVALFLKWTDLTTLGLLFALVAIEVVRMQYTTLLNSERHHRLSGIWAVAEAWGRPILAWAMVVILGISIKVVLAGFLLISVCIFMVMRRFIILQKDTTFSAFEEADLVQRFWTYSLPLLPLGLVGWVSGMADRYIIGMLLSPADVGLYVAIYGLASRPMLMLGAIIESVIRPVYLNALIEGDNNKANGYLKRWALLIVLGSLLVMLLALIGHQWLANILLGAQYRSVSFLLPWIVGGYALLIISYIANRICYANGATKSIFLIEVIGAAIAIIVGFIFIKWGGLKGAAVAIIFYYGAQLVIAFRLAKGWLKIGRNSDVD